MIKKFALTLLAAAAMCLTACNDSNNNNTDGIGIGKITRFATLTSKSDAGSTYVYYDANDQMYTLTTTWRIGNTLITPPYRVIISYDCNWGLADKSGAVDCKGVFNVINGKLEVGSIAQPNTPQYVVSPTQTGPYLNIEARASVNNQPKSYRVVMDQTTEDSNWPTVYLFFESDNEGDNTIKDIYASFDMSAIWNNNKYDGYTLKAVVTAFAGSANTWNFSKPKSQTITPAN